jgi:hypothetical protein
MAIILYIIDLHVIILYRLDPSTDDALLSSEALVDVESLQHFYSTEVSCILCIHATIFSTLMYSTIHVYTVQCVLVRSLYSQRYQWLTSNTRILRVPYKALQAGTHSFSTQLRSALLYCY